MDTAPSCFPCSVYQCCCGEHRKVNDKNTGSVEHARGVRMTAFVAAADTPPIDTLRTRWEERNAAHHQTQPLRREEWPLHFLAEIM